METGVGFNVLHETKSGATHTFVVETEEPPRRRCEEEGNSLRCNRDFEEKTALLEYT